MEPETTKPKPRRGRKPKHPSHSQTAFVGVRCWPQHRDELKAKFRAIRDELERPSAS